METVLIVGSSGNIGVSAVIAALRSKLRVLAIVRNQNSADKIVKHVRNITQDVENREKVVFVEADVLSDTGVKGVVDQVKAGKLPHFQHVWSSVGGEYVPDKLHTLSTERLRRNTNASFESNFFAYRDTIPYLLEQGHPNSTWTICTGAQGETGLYSLPAMTQGALFSMSIAAARDNESNNIRFNEIYLSFRVEVDEDAVAHGVTKSSDFAKAYQLLLADKAIRSSRVRVENDGEDLTKLRHARKF